MDIKEKITETVEKITSDKQLMAKFKEDPIKAIEEVLGVDLPDDLVEKIVAGVKAKMTGDKISGAVSKLKGLFD